MSIDLDFVIIVNDGGEMKAIRRSELETVMPKDPDGMPALDIAINTILDNRAISAGEYDPSDNDTPMAIGMPGDFDHA